MGKMGKMSEVRYYVFLVMTIILVLVVSLGLYMMFESRVCYAKYSTFDPEYGLFSGCMIEYNGLRIPHENYWRG